MLAPELFLKKSCISHLVEVLSSATSPWCFLKDNEETPQKFGLLCRKEPTFLNGIGHISHLQVELIEDSCSTNMLFSG